MEQDKKKKKRFNIFDSQREGRGVEKGEVKSPTFINFFRYYGRSVSRLLSVNLMFTLFCVPLFFFLFAIAFTNKTDIAASSGLFSGIYSAILGGNVNPVTASLLGAAGLQTSTAARMTTASVVLYALTAILLFTWGYANIGMNYVIRNMQRGEPIFLFADFKTTIKQNKAQGLLFGILDLAVIGVIAYDLMFFYLNIQGSSFYSFMFIIMLFISAVYLIMRYYAYLLIVTFDLTILKILKNSLIFVFLGLKRNLLASVGCAVVIIINIFLFGAFMPIGIILPFVLTVSTMTYITVYAAYPKIKEIMIEPYYSEGEDTEDADAREDGQL